MTQTLHEICNEESLRTGQLHLPTDRAHIRNIRKDPVDSGILVVDYYLAPGFASQKPFMTEESLRGNVKEIRYNLQKNYRAWRR